MNRIKISDLNFSFKTEWETCLYNMFRRFRQTLKPFQTAIDLSDIVFTYFLIYIITVFEFRKSFLFHITSFLYFICFRYRDKSHERDSARETCHTHEYFAEHRRFGRP